MKNVILAASLVALSILPASAHEYVSGGLMIDHPYSYATPPVARAGAGYMTITNTGDAADRLLSAEADFANVMIHRTVEKEDGTMAMMHQMGGVEIPAGGSVTFEPGGLHLMFMQLEQPLTVDAVLEVTLTFEKAGVVPVAVKVEKRPSVADHGGDHDHNHNHGHGHTHNHGN